MPVHAFSHYNLRAPRVLLDQLRDFYCGIVGLHLGPRPPFRSFGYWLYAGGRDVLHLTETADGEVRATDAVGTFDHVAFACTGRSGYEHTLSREGIPYHLDRVPQTGQVQLFCTDPAGNGVELNFVGEDA